MTLKPIGCEATGNEAIGKSGVVESACKRLTAFSREKQYLFVQWRWYRAAVI